MIKTAFFVVKNKITEEDIQKEKASIPQFLNEKNAIYIEELTQKKHRPSAYKSLVGLRLLGELAKDMSIRPKLRRTEYGRPYFEALPSLDFNISHSDSMVVCAICFSDKLPVRVGIDCEEIYHKDPMPLAERFFTEKEKAYIRSSTNKAYAFTELWTKKEAYLKHLGTGLATSLAGFETSDLSLHFETFEKNGNLITVCAEKDLF